MSGTRVLSTTSRRELSSRFILQGKAPKEIHAILTETLVCFLPGWAKDLSAPCKVTYCVRFYVLTALNITNTAFWDMTPVKLWAPWYSSYYPWIQNDKAHIPDDLDIHYDIFIAMFLIFHEGKLTNSIWLISICIISCCRMFLCILPIKLYSHWFESNQITATKQETTLTCL